MLDEPHFPEIQTSVRKSALVTVVPFTQGSIKFSFVRFRVVRMEFDGSLRLHNALQGAETEMRKTLLAGKIKEVCA